MSALLSLPDELLEAAVCLLWSTRELARIAASHSRFRPIVRRLLRDRSHRIWRQLCANEGGGTAFVQAMKRGDIDAMVLWEPFESQAVAEGDAYFSQKLEYSQSRAVGAELGMLAASGEAMTQKKELVRRFMWAYLKAEETLSKNKDLFADAYSKYTGLPMNVTKESAKIIKLGGVLTKDQVSRLAEAAFKQGIVQKDVTKEAAALYDDSMVVELKK